jgi:hypothetical protein
VVFTTVTVKNVVWWDLRRVDLVRTYVPEECGTSIITVTRTDELETTLIITSNRTPCLHRLLVTANVVPSSLIIVTLMMEELRFSEISALKRAARHNISEDGILLNVRVLCHQNYKSDSVCKLFAAKIDPFLMFQG